MISKLIKNWIFDEYNRGVTTIESEFARLNSDDRKDPVLQLKQIGKTRNNLPKYSLDDNITIKTRTYKPNALLKWLKFEIVYNTNEESYTEYNLNLKDKNSDVFAYDLGSQFPKVGDRVYQGDIQTFVKAVFANKVELNDGTNINDGRAYFQRSECDVLVQLYDKDGNRYYWNGTWVSAGANDWNTMYVVNNRIESFPIATKGKEIGFIVKLKTLNEKFTPRVSCIKVLGEFDIEFQDDMVFDSVIRSFEDNIDATTQVDLYLASATDEIDFGTEYKLQNDGYNFVDCEICYNETVDPERVIDIKDHYTKGAPRKGGGNEAGKLTLNAVQPIESLISAKLKYFPEIAVNTSIDFYEVGAIPSVIFERIEARTAQVKDNSNFGKDIIKDKIKLTGVQLKTPAQNDLLFEYAVFTGSQIDQQRLAGSFRRLLNNFNMITSWGLDESYPVIIRDVFRSGNKPNASNVNTHVGSFLVKNVVVSIGEPEEVFLVGNLTRGMTTK